MDIQTIKAEIENGNWSPDELRSIIDSVRVVENQLTRMAAWKIVAGNKVRYQRRDGDTVEGVVLKVAVKFATVRIDGCLWRVPLHMLEVI